MIITLCTVSLIPCLSTLLEANFFKLFPDYHSAVRIIGRLKHMPNRGVEIP